MGHVQLPRIRRKDVLTLLLLTVVLAACGTTTPLVTSVTIDQGTTGTLLVGATLNLTATVAGTNGAVRTVTWRSSDAAVATVDTTGKVQAIALGAVTVTATSTQDTAKSDSIAITVDDLPADASNVYVDASWTSGGNGSLATPYRTITAGVTYVAAGGTVHVAAGTYPEGLQFTKALTLAGAGAGNTIITISSDAPGSTAGMGIDGVNGLTLSGFTLSVQAPGPTAAAVSAYGGSSNVTIQNVTISQSDGNDNAGIILGGVDHATIDHVTITDTSGTSAGAGVLVTNSVFGDSSNVALTYLTVNGHRGFAGIVLDPLTTTLSSITVSNATFDPQLLDTFQVNRDQGGSVTGLTAPQYSYVVRNANVAYKSGGYLFYKQSESKAIAQSLYNFDAVPAESYIQQLDGTDQATLLNTFVVGAADGTSFGSPGVLTNSIQTAVDQASAGSTIQVGDSLTETFDGALTLDKSLTITGLGGASKITAPSGTPVITVAANTVAITGVDLDTTDTGNAAVLVSSGVTGLTIHQSNFMSTVGLDDTVGATVNAANNYWNAVDGPGGDGPSSSGSELIDPSTKVTIAPITTTAY